MASGGVVVACGGGGGMCLVVLMTLFCIRETKREMDRWERLGGFCCFVFIVNNDYTGEVCVCVRERD